MTPIGIQLKLGGEREVETGLRRVGGAMDTVGTAASALARAVGGLAGAFAGALSVREFVQAADAVTGLQNQLKLATGSAQAAGVAYNQLYEISQRSRTGFIELGKTFASISTAAADMGVSQQRLLKVTEAIGNAVTISGTGAQAAQAALQQLGQGLASGTLRGEELNSVMEQTPRLAKALADGLGVTRGELRALGQQGAITAEQVIKALESQSSVLQGEVKDATLTVGQAFTQLTNSATRAVGDFDKATGATATLAGTISSLAGAVDTLGGVIRNNEGAFKVLGGTLAGAAVVAGAAGIVKSIGLIGGAVAALGAVLLANPAVLALLGLSAAVGGGVALISAQSKTADGISQAIERLRTENERSEAALARAVAGGRLAGADNIAKTIDARKDQIARLRAELDSLQPSSAGAGGGRGSVNPQTVGAAAAQQAAGEKELIAIRQKLYGVDKDYLPTLDKLHAQYTSGAISIDEYQKLVGKLAEANFKKEKTDPGRGLKSEESAYQNLIATINTKIAQEREELAGAGALTESQRIRIKLDQDLAAGRVKLSAQNERAVRLALEELAASEASALAAKTLAKANLDAAASREKYLTSLSSGLDKIQADIAAQIEATERMGLSKEAIAELDAAKLDMMATDLELQAIKAMDRNLDEQTYDALKQQAQAYRDLAKAKQAGAAKEVAVDAAKKAADEWQRTSDQINQSLTDALMRGFESGKDFAQNMRDTIVNMFKTMVLRPVVSAIVSPVAGALTGALGLSTAAQAGQGGGLSTALGGASLLSSFGSLNAGLSYGAQSLFANGLGTTLTAGTQMLGAGSYMGGLGTIAGALGPIALGIGLLSSLIKKSTPHMGAGVTYSAADGLVRGADQYSQANYGFGAAGEYNSAAESTVGAVARGIATALDSTARTFGRQAGFEISTAFADDKSKDGAWGQLAIRRNGETILDWRDTQTSRWAPREFSDGEAGLQEYQTAVAQSMREALDKMDLPGWAGDMLDALGDSPSIENLGAALDQINAAQVALEQMGKNLVGFADYTSAAIDALVKAAGGVDSLVSAASTYYDNFYTDAEKTANVTRDITAALADVGLQMPTTREDFRALVESQMALGDAGAEAVAALLGVSGAFASVTQSADAAAQAAEQARESAISAAFSALQRAVKREQEWLQARIDVASEARDALSSLFDLLHDNVQDLYGSVSSTAVQQGAQASAYIAQALATARGTGYLPETDALSDAISAARGGMDATQYANQFEADRDRLVLAGQLAELEGMAGEQLTTAERTLKELQQQNDQLEQTLEYWRDQIELSQAGVDATLSVADAIARLQDAMFPGDKPGSGSGSGSAGGAAGFGPGGITWGSQGPEAKYKTPISLATAGVGYQPVTDPEQIARLDSLSSTYHKYDGTGDLVGLLTAMREAGATTADLSALSGYFESDWRRAAESVGIPAFDVGTNRVPRDMLAVVHKDEAIIPAAYNPWAGGGAAAGGNAELVAEVRALRAELAQLRASSAATASNTAQMADQFDNVSGGGNAVRMEAVA